MGTSTLAQGDTYVNGGGGTGVSSFNTRTGAVVPASGDYTQTQITGNRSTPASVTSAITWVGTTAPSGTLTSSYTWAKIGGFCNFQLVLTYTVAGSALTGVNIDIPTDMPTPIQLGAQTTNTSILCAIDGLISSNMTTSSAVSRGTINIVTASASGNQFQLAGAASTAAIGAVITGTYACSN